MKPTSRSRDALELGKVIAIRGTIDKREDTVRATAQKVKLLKPEQARRRAETHEERTAMAAPTRVREDAPITLRFGAGIAAR